MASRGSRAKRQEPRCNLLHRGGVAAPQAIAVPGIPKTLQPAAERVHQRFDGGRGCAPDGFGWRRLIFRSGINTLPLILARRPKCIGHDGLHRILADRPDEPVLDCRSLKGIHCFMKIVFARGVKLRSGLASRPERHQRIDCMRRPGDGEMRDGGIHDGS
jgi:hypothetical protein